MQNKLMNIVRKGQVQSIDAVNRTAIVKFHDLNLISGNLTILNNSPVITIEKWYDNKKWSHEGKYASAYRDLDYSENNTKKYPDVIESNSIFDYYKSIPLGHCSESGKVDKRPHKEIMKVYPWLPYIDQYVLCIYDPRGEGDGFIIGGIT